MVLLSKEAEPDVDEGETDPWSRRNILPVKREQRLRCGAEIVIGRPRSSSWLPSIVRHVLRCATHSLVLQAFTLESRLLI